MRLNIRKWMSSLFATALLMLALSGIALAQDSNARIRFVHALPGASAVDVYTDGQLTISGLAIGQASTYVTLPAGPHQLTVTQNGATTPLWQQDVNPGVGAALTLIAASTDPLSFLVYQDDLNPLPLGKARFTAVHAIPGGPAVDVVLADGRPIIIGLEYGQPYGTTDVPAASYDLAVVPTGAAVDTAILTLGPTALTSGTSYIAVVYGSAASPQALLLASPTGAEVESGFVRFAHAVPDAPSVDIYVNDTLVSPSLAFGVATEHIAVPGGSYTASVRIAGTDQEILSLPLDVVGGSAATIVAIGSVEAIDLLVAPDDISGLSPSEASVNVINALSDAPISLSNGGTTISDIVAGSASGVAAFAPSTDPLSLTTADGTLEINTTGLYGGVLYSVIAVSGAGDSAPTLIVAPTSLVQGIASAPGAVPAVAVEPTSVPTEVPVEPTTVPALATSTPVEVVAVQPTIEPAVTIIVVTATPDVAAVPVATEVSQVVPAVPTAAPAQPTGPTARVILDPGANLQLRQYPTSSALSLGLAPSGTILLVNGRIGQEITIDGFTPTPDPLGTPFVDPASLLPNDDEDADLLPEETWLNVIFNTPDGGQIIAWVNALYVDVRTPAGEEQRLADLPTVPANQAGEAINTAVTPPPVPSNVVSAVAGNLDTGVNLQIRRTLGTSGEVLARVPSGTAMELLGLNETREWAFVRYSPAGGGSITGWVTTAYISYSYNNRDIDLEEMEQRELLVIVPDDERGDLRDAAAAPLPTVDPLRDVVVAEVVIDPGANLHLRRNPDANSESLALIPAGARLVVGGRSSDGQWLSVTFEETQGWISSSFVRLTFNGAPTDLIAIPNISGVSDILALGTLTPTPTAIPAVLPSVTPGA